VNPDTPDTRRALEQLSVAIAAVMEDHAPAAAHAIPTNFVELARRFLVLRRAGADIRALADGALALTRQFPTSAESEIKSL
jgi:hypothetical protein